MRRVLGVLGFIGLVALPLPAPAAEVYFTTLTSTGTSVSGQIENGRRILIQCDAAAYYAWGSSTVTVSASTGVKLAADEKLDTSSGVVNSYLAVISVSGTANCRVFRVLGAQ